MDSGHVELVDHMGTDLTVVNSARVSFSNESEWSYDEEALNRVKTRVITLQIKEEFRKLPDKDVKLIRYLAKHKHWTPFAHPQITLRIKAPIPIRTQFFKHKQGFVENEISRRYVDFEPDFYIPKFRKRPENGMKQGSGEWIECSNEGNVSGGIATHPLYRSYSDLMERALNVYNELLESGVAPEQARFALPQAMYTEWYWTGSLAAYARFYSQRIDDHAQWEIRQYAEAVGKIIKPLFPVSWQELTEA